MFLDCHKNLCGNAWFLNAVNVSFIMAALANVYVSKDLSATALSNSFFKGLQCGQKFCPGGILAFQLFT